MRCIAPYQDLILPAGEKDHFEETVVGAGSAVYR